MKRILTTTLIALFASAVSAQAVFTSSGTFTVPAGVTSITAELVGAGGNGGFNGGGGGGGGGYARGTFTVSPGTTISIVVGDGGSELGTIMGGFGILAGAGLNGTTVPNPNIGGGGAGGAGLGGSVNRTGGTGGGGYYTYFGGGGGGAAGYTANGGNGGNTIAWTGICLTPGGTAGIGGGAPGGDGGKGAGFTDVNCTVSDPGADGVAYGGGGGGGNGIGSPVGIGGGGVCIISWAGATGIDDPAVDTSIQLLSNPFTDHIGLRTPSGNERYELRDATGRMVWIGAHIEEHDFSDVRPGAYVLRVIEGDTVRAIKAVKQSG